MTIWGGCANTKSLEFGVQSGDYANNGYYDDSDCDNMKNSWKMVIHQMIEMKDLINHLHRQAWQVILKKSLRHQTQAKRKFMII